MERCDNIIKIVKIMSYNKITEFKYSGHLISDNKKWYGNKITITNGFNYEKFWQASLSETKIIIHNITDETTFKIW